MYLNTIFTVTTFTKKNCAKVKIVIYFFKYSIHKHGVECDSRLHENCYLFSNFQNTRLIDSGMRLVTVQMEFIK